MKKLVSVMLVCVMLAMTAIVPASAGAYENQMRYLPTMITVTSNSVTIEGYFVNTNSRTVSGNVNDFELEIYQNGKVIAYGYFSEPFDIHIAAHGMTSFTFTINGTPSLSSGTYICDDSYYAMCFGSMY